MLFILSKCKAKSLRELKQRGFKKCASMHKEDYNFLQENYYINSTCVYANGLTFLWKLV